MLVVYHPSWLPVFFSSNYHGATPICRGTNRYRTDDASFDIFPKGFLYLLFVMFRTGIRLCLALGVEPSFRGMWAGGPGIAGNFPLLLKKIWHHQPPM